MLFMTIDIPRPDLAYLLFFIAVVVVWSLSRPGAIRDDDHRHLPDKPVARLTFVMISVALYLALVVSFMVLPGPIGEFASNLSFVGNFFSQRDADQHIARFAKEAPFSAALVMGAVSQLPIIKDFERSILIRLHSASNLMKDVAELRYHLHRCAFEPSPIEHQRNLDLSKKYGVHVDSSDFQHEVPLPMLNWRKVSSLTRLISEWNEPETKRILDRQQMAELEQVARAHERKTAVVLEIVKLVEQVELGALSPETLMRSIQMLEDTPNADHESITEVGTKLRSLIGHDTAKIIRPLKISSTAFRRDIARIGSYFQEEYEILLSQASDLASRSVVLAGADAPRRLEALKDVGFAGLGRIKQVNLDRVLLILFGISFLGFVVLFVGNKGTDMNPDSVKRLALFAIVMSVAALAGTLIGSHRRYAKAPDTPWAIYFAGGFGSAVAMIILNWVTDLIRLYQTAEPHGAQAFSFSRLAPWTLLPFLVTVSICRLGRVDSWFGRRAMGNHAALIERCIDGACVSLSQLVGTYGAIATLILLHEQLPKSVLDGMANANRIMPLPIFGPLQVLGFLIGFATVRNVRSGAHSRMIETPQRRPPAAPPSTSAPEVSLNVVPVKKDLLKDARTLN